MKRTMACVLLAMIFSVSFTTVYAVEVEDFVYEGDANGVSLYDYYGDEKDLIIPSLFDSYDEYGEPVENVPLVSIRRYAFSENQNLRSVVVPEGVEYIGANAFANCPNLVSVILPKSVKYIEDQAFYYCENLKEIILPDSLEHVGDYVFLGCEKLNLTKEQRNVFLLAEQISSFARDDYYIADPTDMIDLAPFLNTDFDDFVNFMLKQTGSEWDDVVEVEYGTERRYYYDGIVEFLADKNDTVGYISIDEKSNYRLMGFYFSMEKSDAQKELERGGWELAPGYSSDFRYAPYYNSNGNEIALLLDDEDGLQSMHICYADETSPDGFYPGAHTTGNVNLRSGPTLNDRIIKSIPIDTEIEYLGNSSIDDRGVVWYNIRFENQEGWGSSKYILVY